MKFGGKFDMEGSGYISYFHSPDVLSIYIAAIKFTADGPWVSENATVLEVSALQFYLSKWRLKPSESSQGFKK